MTEIKIILDDNGNCRVEDPIDQKMLCYGMLELAKEAIHIHHISKQRIIPASTLPFIPKLGNN